MYTPRFALWVEDRSRRPYKFIGEYFSWKDAEAARGEYLDKNPDVRPFDTKVYPKPACFF
jgi:hypothetical protein